MVNYSDELKYIWWGVGACGSGSMSTLLKQEFGLIEKARNTAGIPEGKEGYSVIVNVRNPYCWEISSYLDQKEDPRTFEEYLNNGIIQGHLDYVEKYKPDYFIRCEDMYSDMQKIPNLANQEPTTGWEKVKAIINNPTYKRSREIVTKEMLAHYWN